MEAGTRTPTAALLERDRELARLAGAIEGVGSVVALEGGAGIGKTALLFVTSRTIEAHLTQTYMKLAITSREQLTTALRFSH